VSFQAPLFLLALLALPVLLGLYLLIDRRRRKAAAGFASPLLAPSFAPLRPGFRRHAPMLAYALAIAVAAIALARPEATVAVPEERAAVVLATDISGSMESSDVPPSRMSAVREAAANFVEAAPSELRVGAVAFNHAVQAIEPPSADRQGVQDLIERMRPSGGTATGKGLAASLSLLRREGQRPSERAPGAVILLSDGTSTHGRDPLPVARDASRTRVPIYTVALGTDGGTIEVERRGGGTVTREVPPDRDAMQRIATLSGGRTFSADADDELATVYEQLGSRIATREEQREVTAAFAGGAALLLLLGGGMSLRWFGRLP
jgi:Ca-activated chloride channel family protein